MVRQNEIWNSFSENTDPTSSEKKRSSTIWLVISTHLTTPLLPRELAACTSGKASSVQVLEQHMLPSRNFIQESTCIFVQGNDKPRISIKTAWLPITRACDCEICKSVYSVFIYILLSLPTFLQMGLYDDL